MYLITMIGIPGSFFTDNDPTVGPGKGTQLENGFACVNRAEFHDSYTPTDKVKQQREHDAVKAFQNESTRPVRINPDAVATSTLI